MKWDETEDNQNVVLLLMKIRDITHQKKREGFCRNRRRALYAKNFNKVPFVYFSIEKLKFGRFLHSRIRTSFQTFCYLISKFWKYITCKKLQTFTWYDTIIQSHGTEPWLSLRTRPLGPHWPIFWPHHCPHRKWPYANLRPMKKIYL